MPEDDVDLVVVGGGPVGVSMALLAVHRGLSARVLERSLDVYPLPRAVVMDDEVQRVFQGVGLAEGLAAVTTPLRGAEYVDADRRRIVGLELPEPVRGPLGHHLVVCYDQPELEAWLRAEAVAAGVDLRLGVEVTGVDPGPDEVMVLAADGGHRARWVVAADGAASPVRKALGIAFEDQGFDQEWLVVDVDLTDPTAALPDLVQQVCDPARPVTYVPGHRTCRRWEFQLQPGEDPVAMANEDAVWGLLDGWLGPEQGRLRRSVVYRFHATVAEHFRSGRIFLAGDAAHQMPPFLGQGLCAGVRDAANLTWKLAAVSAGDAGDRLLDSYEVERRPHSAAVVAHAVDAGRLIDQFAGRTDTGTAEDAAYGGGRPFPHLTTGVLAGDHPLVGHQLPQPTLGDDDRLGPGWALLRAPGTRADPLPFEAREVVLPVDDLAALAGPGITAILVRPDRQVAVVAPDEEALAAAVTQLSTWFTGGPP